MQISFPTRERRERILAIALPMIGGMLSQNVFNLVDTAMVGVLGDQALAAVGVSSFLNFMAVAFVMGMAAGVQATAARWLGAGRTQETAVPLNGGLILAGVIALPLSLILIVATPFFFVPFSDDPGVASLGVPYLQIRLVAMLGVGFNFAFRGYWAAVAMTRIYMRTLVTMHVANIALNWLLIFGNLGFPEMGVSGAALASVISIYLGTAIYFAQGLRYARAARFLHGVPDPVTLKALMRLSAPAGLQSFLFAAGLSALFWILGQLGTPEQAAGLVLTQVGLVGILPLIGFGVAGGSLVGQALGRGDHDDAERWGWEVSLLAMGIIAVLGLPVVLQPDMVLRLFLHEPETLALARAPLRLLACTLWGEATGIVLLQAHLGAGDTRRVMLISVLMQWGVFLPIAYWVGPVLGLGLLAVWAANAAYRLVQAGVFAWSWRQRRWTRVRI